MPKLLHPLPKGRRVVRRRVLPRLPQLQSRRVRFIRNLPLLSPKPSADSSPPEPPSNPTHKRLKLQLISQILLPLSSERLTAPFPFPSLVRLTTKAGVIARYRPSHPCLGLYPLFGSPHLEVEQSLSDRQLPLGNLQTRSERSTTLDSLRPSCLSPLGR